MLSHPPCFLMKCFVEMLRVYFNSNIAFIHSLLKYLLSASWESESVSHSFDHDYCNKYNKCIKCNNVINIIVTLFEKKNSFVSAIVMVNCYYIARIPYNWLYVNRLIRGIGKRKEINLKRESSRMSYLKRCWVEERNRWSPVNLLNLLWLCTVWLNLIWYIKCKIMKKIRNWNGLLDIV